MRHNELLTFDFLSAAFGLSTFGLLDFWTLITTWACDSYIDLSIHAGSVRPPTQSHSRPCRQPGGRHDILLYIRLALVKCQAKRGNSSGVGVTEPPIP